MCIGPISKIQNRKGKRGRKPILVPQTFYCVGPHVRGRMAAIAVLANYYSDGERHDGRSEYGQQLGDSHVEVAEIVTLDR